MAAKADGGLHKHRQEPERYAGPVSFLPGLSGADDPKEILQAAKYVPYLEIVFGPDYEVIPVLVLTGATDVFSFHPAGEADMVLPVCSGDMLFNVFDEYLRFLK